MSSVQGPFDRCADRSTSHVRRADIGAAAIGLCERTGIHLGKEYESRMVRRAAIALAIAVAGLLGASGVRLLAQSPNVAVRPRQHEQRCDTDLRVAAALYDAVHPARSWIVLRSPTVATGRPYIAGMTVGTYTIEQVRPTAVLLRDSSGPCWLGMFNLRSRAKVARERGAAELTKSLAAAATRRDRKPSAPTRRSAFSRAELRAGVRKVDENRFVVSDWLVDAAVARAAKIAASHRFATVQNGNRAVGVRIARLPRRGLLAQIGLERGDLLKTVNGYPLADAKDIVDAYARLSNSKRLTLVVQRGRRTLNLDYRIQ
jgi:hypothetical protein